MIDTKELRRLAQAAPLPQTDYVLGLEGDGYTSDYLFTEPGYSEEQMRDYVSQTISELLDRLEAAENERDTLRAKIEAMEKQEPVATVYYKAGNCIRWVEYLGWQKLKDGTNLYALPGAKPASSVPECPYPCGWQNLLKYAIEDGAYLARSLNEDEPVTENARVVAMRMVLRLRDVLMAINNAAPEAKPCP